MRTIKKIPAAEVWKNLMYDVHVKVIDEEDLVYDLFTMPAADAAGMVYAALEEECDYIFFAVVEDYE